MALVKTCGGIRHIAIGDVIRRLASKLCCTVSGSAEGAKVIFGTLQIGVTTSGGAGASVHAVRRLARDSRHDPGKLLLKVDVSHAFNMVDRTAMLPDVYTQLPGLYAWVAHCYAQPGMLFFGGIILLSQAGVQQDYPSGLFCSVCFIELSGGFTRTGTFTVVSLDR